uniref:HP domain-containing protein n=1 Tax=Musa acuminata subsp. malaccensis TaxID=214687 RepID=A0A804J249_MUSAM|nr:PREDICTED: villin-3-like [Musa acuminata subsp. malaccensis]
MSSSTKYADPAFQGVGHKVGTEIWRIENFQPVPIPKSDYGKFYSGDSYIILQTTGKGGTYLYDIHFWIGKESSQDEAGTAAIKTVELDAVLGGRAVQHREPQGFESDKFLSYFKPCIIPLEGGFASGFKKPEEEKFETRLYTCRGKRVVRMKQVPFARSSLNHDDVFILDTEKKIYQFNGANTNIQERAKALEVIQYLKDKYHEGTCDIAIIDDGKLQADSDSGEFWVLFGGFAPIGKKVVSEDDTVLKTSPAKLYGINDGQLKLEENNLSKAMLENNKCYLLDCGAEVIIWVGRVTQVEERKAASKAAEDFIISQNRPKTTRVTQVIQGYETHSFKSKFESWSAGTVTGMGNSTGEEGQGKVAALLKQQGVDFKGILKGCPVNEEIPPLLEGGGKLEVWRINGSAKNPLPREEIGRFYSGDCYIVLYTYRSGEKKEDYLLTCWMGKDSIQASGNDHVFPEEAKEKLPFSVLLSHDVIKSFLWCIYPLRSNVVWILDAYNPLKLQTLMKLIFSKSVKTDTVATSLSSTDCFILQSGNSLFTWHGSSSTFEQQQWAARIAEFLKPDVALKHAKEGTESSAFWFALGGKQSFTTKKVTQDITRDPHLYTFSFNKGKLEVTEVYNYSQDDLLTEDMLVLDTHAEVFLWIGQSVDSKDKQKAFDIGQKYIELAVLFEGLSPDVPLFKVTEGNEPCFFTTYFSWDSAKATIHGNSFLKKLAHLFGASIHASESKDKSTGVHHGGATQRASALAALSSAFNPSLNNKTTAPKPSRSSQGSQRAAAVAALSSVLATEQKKGESETSTRRFSRSPSPVPVGTINESAKTESAGSESGDSLEISAEKETTEGNGILSDSNGADSDVATNPQIDENGGECTFTYERLKAKSSNPVSGIDYKRREAYLSDAEFQTTLGMTKEAFYRQPKWKQDMQKRKVDLF